MINCSFLLKKIKKAYGYRPATQHIRRGS